jgi:AcrR family transcriptional regulator
MVASELLQSALPKGRSPTAEDACRERRLLMPKIVDHEARRAELAEALWRVLARDGIEGATVRAVTAEAGWSRGIIEHYFTSKEEMLRCACQLGSERVLAQVEERHRTLSGREALRAALLDGLALDGKRLEAAGIWLELLSAASHRPALGAELARFDVRIRVVFAAIIAEMVARGEAAADLDPEVAAASIFAFNLGLNMRVRLEPERYTDEVVKAEVEAFLLQLSQAPHGEMGAG